MHVFTRFVVCVGFAASLVRSSRGQEFPQVDSAAIDQLFAKWDRDDVPGMAVGVFVDGKKVHAAGYGMANLDEGLPIKSESVFATFSMAKTFTTACTAILLDEGRITLDDDIRQHLPELPQYATTVKIRHLLRCRSGLMDYLHALMLSGRDINDVFTKEEVYDMICRQKTTPFAAGTKHKYSNTDFFLLGLIVERVSGSSLREFADRKIFSQLGMHNTFFDDDRSEILKNRVLGYGRRGDGSYHRLGMNSSTVGPIGLKTTVDDLLKWDQNFRDNKLGSGPRVQEFFSTGWLIDNDNCLCGYGNRKYRGLKRICQTGGGPGFMAHFVRFPDHGLSVAVLSNLSEVDQWHAMKHAVAEIAELFIGKQFTQSPKAVEWDKDPKTVQLTAAQLQARTGSYRRPDGMFVRLVVDEGSLALDKFNSAYPPPLPIRLTSLSKNRFREAVAHVPFDILFDTDSPESAITVRYRDGYKQKWQRVEFASPDHNELDAYVGEYLCDNLDAVHRFSIKNDQLFVQFNNGRPKPLVPATADIFVPTTGRSDNMQFEFSRDESGRVKSYEVSFERVNCRFIKR